MWSATKTDEVLLRADVAGIEQARGRGHRATELGRQRGDGVCHAVVEPVGEVLDGLRVLANLGEARDHDGGDGTPDIGAVEEEPLHTAQRLDDALAARNAACGGCVGGEVLNIEPERFAPEPLVDDGEGSRRRQAGKKP